MANLLDCRLCVGQSTFFSTGMNCCGPYTVKLGRRQEKQWGLTCNFMTTKVVHLEILASMDADALHMAFRRFATQRGLKRIAPSDCGTNFMGAETELKEYFKDVSKELQKKLIERQVEFHFNPPSAPHFKGTWEIEMKTIKNALKCCLKDQVVPKAVLQKVMMEVEGLINSMPLGCKS
ncbi:hypothetical protein HOLleu_14930 [Holothuria leucospilota]|uniref:Integrase catalytic domain-containing protein n=1 Tax=Holothuria leucospilota TaxID=206669 RepID=A0A9Q1C9M2_HOLLE|nr:hypothetical protein HOLleu_14930 [Holothuria leucospilota]